MKRLVRAQEPVGHRNDGARGDLGGRELSEDEGKPAAVTRGAGTARISPRPPELQPHGRERKRSDRITQGVMSLRSTHGRRAVQAEGP
jgi:hypothetical protein